MQVGKRNGAFVVDFGFHADSRNLRRNAFDAFCKRLCERIKSLSALLLSGITVAADQWRKS